MDKNLLKFYGEMSGAVMFKILMMVGAFFVGKALDERFHCYPLCSFLFLVTAMALGIWLIYYVATRGNEGG